MKARMLSSVQSIDDFRIMDAAGLKNLHCGIFSQRENA